MLHYFNYKKSGDFFEQLRINQLQDKNRCQHPDGDSKSRSHLRSTLQTQR